MFYVPKVSSPVAASLFALMFTALLAFTAPDPAQAQSRPVVREIPFPEGVEQPGRAPRYSAGRIGEGLHFRMDGETRLAYLYAGAPAKAASGRLPSVILLHGANRDGRSMLEMWQGVAEAHAIVLIALDSEIDGWQTGEDGVRAIRQVWETAAGRVSLDPKRVYLFGHSSGGLAAAVYANGAGRFLKAAALHGAGREGMPFARARNAAPVRIYLGEKDGLFPVWKARDMAGALARAGHRTELVVIREHTHWFYLIGPWIAADAWAFFESVR